MLSHHCRHDHTSTKFGRKLELEFVFALQESQDFLLGAVEARSMSRLRTSFEKTRTIGPLHTGGPFALTADGQSIITCSGEEAILTRLEDGAQLARFFADGETIYSLCLTPSSSHLVIFTASLTLFVFEDPLVPRVATKRAPNRKIHRAHDAPVHVCKFDPTSTLLASGSADGVVKVWDIKKGYATHAFKGHGGVVSALTFRFVRNLSTTKNIGSAMQLISASVDTRIRIFDLSSTTSRTGTGKPSAVLEGHVSVPRGLDVSPDGRWLLSGGRDSVAIVWDLMPPFSATPTSKGKGKRETWSPILTKTITVLERIEAIGWITEEGGEQNGEGSVNLGNRSFFTAGERGVVKIWNVNKEAVVFTLGQEIADATDGLEQQREVLDACYIESLQTICTVHADQNIFLFSLKDREITRQLIGFNDEIIDATFISPTSIDSHIAIAANSSLIRIYPVIGNDSRLLSGHSSLVLCLDKSSNGSLLASGSKDNTARLWHFSRDIRAWSCIGVCTGHTGGVGAIALARQSTSSEDDWKQGTFMFTGSQDRTIKMWDLSNISDGEHDVLRFKSFATFKAHEKDINSLDVSPNDQFLASGSQDKTAKIYRIVYSKSSSGSRGDIKLLGTCKGHKRGIWAVRFGKSERLLATGSGDKTVKLWTLDDFTCVKTFEGHSNSILRVQFLNNDLQLLTSSSDGLMKLWSVQNEECLATMDNHEDKIWALALSSNERFAVTGAADSVITIWKDNTEEKALEKLARKEEAVLREQDLLNFVTVKDYRSAISLAIAMNQPGRLLSIFKAALSSVGESQDMASISGNSGIDEVLKKLPPVELASLLRHIRDWNTHAKNSGIAQSILLCLFKLRNVDDIFDAFKTNLEVPSVIEKEVTSIGEMIQSLIPYTERHLTRMDRLVQETYLLDYVLNEMDGGLMADEDISL